MRKKPLFWLVVIMVIASFFRLWAITDIPPGLYPDEAMNGNNALYALQSGDYKVFYPENNGREGLFINIVALSIKMFGNHPWAIRLPSALFGILTVLGLYLLTRELFRDLNPKHEARSTKQYLNSNTQNSKQFKSFGFRIWNLFRISDFGFRISTNERIALLAAFFLAISFWHVNFSRIGFRAIMAPFFLVWAMYFLWLIFRNNLSNSKKTIASALGGIFFGLGFHTYIAYRIMPLLLIIPAVKALRERTTNKNSCLPCFFILFIFFALIAVFPLAWHFTNVPQDFLGRTSQISIFSAANPLKELGLNIVKTLGMFWVAGDYNWRHNFAGSPQLLWPIGILFLFGIITTIKKATELKNKNKILSFGSAQYPYWLLALWFDLALLPVVISAEGIPHALRAIIAIPPVMIISALGLESIIVHLQNLHSRLTARYKELPEITKRISRIKKEIALLIFFILISLTILNFNKYFLKWAYNPNVGHAFSQTYAQQAKWLNSLPLEVQKYVIINVNGVNVKTPDNDSVFPMPSQTIMFLTNTWTKRAQEQKNITYLNAEEIDKIKCEQECVIIALENKNYLSDKIKPLVPESALSVGPGFPVLIK